VHLLQSRTDEAIVWLEKARSALPGIPFHRSRLASAYALRGEIERAPMSSPKPADWPWTVGFRASRI
jgi:hypothetical protein